MKFKGLTKLALSGVALAAVAATLGTSTYAWYISNTTATVSGAQGSTADANTEGSLYAAGHVDHAKGQWKNKVALTGGAAVNNTNTDYVNTVRLSPVTRATAALTADYNEAAGLSQGDQGYVTATSGFVDKAGTVVANGAAYLTFDFYLISRGATNVEVAPEMTVVNNGDADTNKQSSYAGTHLPGGLTATGAQFKQDAVFALKMEIENDAAYTDAQATTAVQTQDYSVAKVANYTAAKTGMVTGGAANLYYNDVVDGVNLYGCDASGAGNLCVDVEAPNSTWDHFFLKPNEETHITFKVWLEGTDADCFDSCVSQAFAFSFEFKIV